MPNLYLRLKHVPENRPEAYPRNMQAWGQLEFCYDDGFDQTPLLQVEWQLKEFVRWLVITHLKKLSDPFGMKQALASESLAQTMARIPKQFTAEYSGYVSSHNLRTGLFYSYLCPDIYLGLRQEPHEGEMSLTYLDKDYSQIRSDAKFSYPEPEWAYRFDLRHYFQDARLEALRFLEEWLDLAPDKHLKLEAQNYLRWLIQIPESLG